MGTHDANGSITDITDELASLDRSDDYDKLDRLNGNRTTKAIAGATHIEVDQWR